MTVLYIRVSSEGQNTARQEDELKNWAIKTGSTNTQTIIEKISGTVQARDRQFNKIFSIPDVKRVVVKSVDRLGRDTIDIMTTIRDLGEKGINVTITALNIDTLTPDGKVDIRVNFMLNMMAAVAQMDKDMIGERRDEGIAAAKKRDKNLPLSERTYKGRQHGATKTLDKLLAENKAVVKELKKDSPLSLRKIAAIGGCSVNTVQKVKRAILEAA